METIALPQNIQHSDGVNNISKGNTPHLDRWLRYCDTLTWRARSALAGGTLDHSSFLALVRARTLCVPMPTAITEIARRIAAAGVDPDTCKLARQARNAYLETAPATLGNRHCSRLAKKPKRQCDYNPEALRRYAARLGYDATREWLWVRSRLHPDNQTPGQYLWHISQPGNKFVIFDVFKSQGCEVWEHPGDTGKINHLNHLQEGRKGVWFLAQPVDGQWREIDRLKDSRNPTGHSRRAEENVTSWLYGVLESDRAPKQQWLNALAQLPLPIVSITDTGSPKGPHALVLVGAESKPHWDEIVRDGAGRALTLLGADYGALKAVQLTRLPSCHRGKTGQWQRLLYLDPDPDGVPICQKPVLWIPNRSVEREDR